MPYFEAITDSIRHGGASEAQAEGLIRSFFSRAVLERSHKAAGIRWSAVLSFCLDSEFENDFRQQASTRPGVNVTSVREFGGILPPRTIPVFRLLGGIDTDDIALTTSAYKIRASSWPHAARAFVDIVKAAPIMGLGMGDCGWGLAEILAPLMSSAFTAPFALVFLEGDPLLDEPLIHELVGGRTSLVSVAASANEVLNVADGVEQEIQLGFAFQGSADARAVALTPFRDLLVLVAATANAGDAFGRASLP